MIKGVGNRILKRLEENGIGSVERLVELEEKELVQILPNVPEKSIREIRENAELYVQHAIIIKKPFRLPPPKDVIYFDLESTTSMPRKVFLATFATFKDLMSVFEEQYEKNKLIEETTKFLKSHEEKYLMSSSGNSWDYNALISTFKKAGYDHSLISNRVHIDLYKILKENIKSPVGLGIKNLSKFLGFNGFDRLRAIDKKINGYVVAKIYESGRYSENKKNLIIKYNQLDVEALRFIHLTLTMLLNEKKTGIVYVSNFE